MVDITAGRPGAGCMLEYLEAQSKALTKWCLAACSWPFTALGYKVSPDKANSAEAARAVMAAGTAAAAGGPEHPSAYGTKPSDTRPP